ncbi:MAG: hypothetical protein IEMM0008_0573 [bacterium]|nr:MAG: hypothetical protein IEMM0008_0573 [bacterium]
MRKNYLILTAAVALVILTFIVYGEPEAVWAKSGKKLFNSEGCSGCHTQLKGKIFNRKKNPFPSREHMANRTFKVFYDCVTKGRSGTPMVPKKHLSKSDIHSIYHWLQKYK